MGFYSQPNACLLFCFCYVTIFQIWFSHLQLSVDILEIYLINLYIYILIYIFLCLHKCAWLLKPSPIVFFHFVGLCRKIGGNWTVPLYVWPSTTRVWAPAKWLEKLGSGSKRWCWSWPLLPPPTGHFQKRKPTCIHDHPWIDFHVYSHMQVCLLIFCIHKHMWMFKCVCNCINTLKWKSEGIHIREHRQQTLQSYVFLLVEDWQDVLEFHFTTSDFHVFTFNLCCVHLVLIICLWCSRLFKDTSCI